MASATITDQDINYLLRLAAGYGTWCVGMPEAEMMVLLRDAQDHLRAQLALKFGSDAANAIVEAFPAAVISARRAIEADTSGVLN
jgi:hypothetical protein